MNIKTSIIAALMCIMVQFSCFGQKVTTWDNSYNYKRATEEMDKQNYDEALKFFNEEVKEHKNNYLAWGEIALLNAVSENYGPALSAINSAIKYNDKKDKETQAWNYYTRCRLHLELADTIEAFNDINKAIELQPEDASNYYRRGQIYLAQENFDSAIADFKKCQEFDPGKPTGFITEGYCYILKKEYDKAIECENHAILLDASSCYAYNDRALAYSEKGQYNKAIDDYITTFKIDPSNDLAFSGILHLCDKAFNMVVTKLKIQMNKDSNAVIWPYVLGCVYDLKDNNEKAIECFQKCYNIEPLGSFAERLANCYNSTGNNQHALEIVNKALETDSADYNLLLTKSTILFDMRNVSEAVETVTKAIEQEPENDFGYQRRAWYNECTNNKENAIEDYSLAISLDSTEMMYYIGRGKLYRALGQDDLAQADFQHVIDNDTTMSNERAYALGLIGRTDEGKKAVQEVIDKSKDSEKAGNYYDAACFYSLIGEKEEAINNLKKCFELGYNSIAHTEIDPDLNNIRDLSEYKDIIAQSKAKLEQKQAQVVDNNKYETIVSEIPYTKSGGVTNVKCTINGVPMKLVFDTGAADVTISSVEAAFLFKNEYLSQKDIIGTGHYVDANGDVNEGTIINIKELVIGDVTLNNIKASVVHSQTASMLLGQSVFQKLGKIEIDNSKQVIKFTYKKKVSK